MNVIFNLFQGQYCNIKKEIWVNFLKNRTLISIQKITESLILENFTIFNLAFLTKYILEPYVLQKDYKSAKILLILHKSFR